jgi:hypothetical protein
MRRVVVSIRWLNVSRYLQPRAPSDELDNFAYHLSRELNVPDTLDRKLVADLIKAFRRKRGMRANGAPSRAEALHALLAPLGYSSNEEATEKRLRRLNQNLAREWDRRVERSQRGDLDDE